MTLGNFANLFFFLDEERWCKAEIFHRSESDYHWEKKGFESNRELAVLAADSQKKHFFRVGHSKFLFLARFSWLIELKKVPIYDPDFYGFRELFCVCLDFAGEFCDLFDFCLTNSLDKIYAGLQHS